MRPHSSKGRNTEQDPGGWEDTGRDVRGWGRGEAGRREERQERDSGALTCCSETLRSHKCPGARGPWCSASWGSQHPRAS